ncbi:MAG TPA: hypothetical protein VFM88_13330 [Vicinamibacteria bacterium]|nr:hypothetical protein [Vicinamibacteria bacterium]
MASSRDRLTPLQNDLLDAFFRHERGFFLTGGAALPAGVRGTELRAWLGDVVTRLLRAAAPEAR